MKPLPAIRPLLFAALFGILLSACSPAAPVVEATATLTSPLITVPTYTIAPSNSPQPSATFTLTPSPTETVTPLPTSTPTETPTQTPTSTPAILRGKVLEHSNCRYGPGPVFLYKYGILPDTNMDVIGRDEAGTWLLVQAIGGDNPCWLKATLMAVRGDVMTVAEVDPDIILPWTPYYPNALTGVWATRSGSEVTVSWDPLITKAGDEIKLEAGQTFYVIEAWVCKSGKLTFTVVGSNTTVTRITDETGCSLPSHGRVYGADKHGYTPWREIPWP